ncbi:RES domain-containing protein [Algoriphagus aquaeductus]|jgi:RES domain-containing protein|uniref:RES domain-containing protein n=1 Tax=Algoriphagus aquaeductus TaxID=475299 RepID=A0A326RUC9_9BACT|nr:MULTISPECIES: RES family NAD+ phosphorylase [Algoriphagus]PZV84530.1 RES domain-containing protein [Algoriphagus aquaeductus]
MFVFRIEREKYLNSTLSGIGASLSEGFRWNSLSTRMVYTAESRALAILEVSVHLDIQEDLPTDRNLITLEIPDDVEILELDPLDLPLNWDSKPPILETQLIGDEFVQQQEAAVLRVPSAIVPEEFNYLINPLHPDAQRIRMTASKSLIFDSRLRK